MAADEFLKLFSFSNDIAQRIARGFFETTVLSCYNNSLSKFLGNNKHTIYHLWSNKVRCCVCVNPVTLPKNQILYIKQFEKMFIITRNYTRGHFIQGKQNCLCAIELNAGCNLDNLDITIINTLLKNCASLSPNDAMKFEGIVDIRNKVSHAPNPEFFSRSELETFWKQMEFFVLELTKSCPLRYALKSFEKEIKHLKNSLLAAEEITEIVDIIKKENESLAALIQEGFKEDVRLLMVEQSKDTKQEFEKLIRFLQENFKAHDVSMNNLTFNVEMINNKLNELDEACASKETPATDNFTSGDTKKFIFHKAISTIGESVGYIWGNKKEGTCWRVGEDKVITAFHVVECNIWNPTSDGDGALIEPLIANMRVDFNYLDKKSDESQCFKLHERLYYHDKTLDIAVLRLKTDPSLTLPPPIDMFDEITPKKHSDQEIFLISHSKGESLEVNSGIGLYNPTEQNMKELQEFCKDFVDEGNGYVGLDNKSRLVIKCKFLGGASGCPGFTILKDGKPRVVLIYLKGYPSFYYSQIFSKEKKERFPQDKLLQQGVGIYSLYRAMTQNKFYLDLRNEIFPLEAERERQSKSYAQQNQYAMTGDNLPKSHSDQNEQENLNITNKDQNQHSNNIVDQELKNKDATQNLSGETSTTKEKTEGLRQVQSQNAISQMAAVSEASSYQRQTSLCLPSGRGYQASQTDEHQDIRDEVNKKHTSLDEEKVDSENKFKGEICEVRWFISTPRMWNLPDIKKKLEEMASQLKLSFRIRFAYVGSLIIHTTVDRYILNDITTLNSAIESFLKKIVEFCEIDTSIKETVHVEMVFREVPPNADHVESTKTCVMERLPEELKGYEEITQKCLMEHLDEKTKVCCPNCKIVFQGLENKVDSAMELTNITSKIEQDSDELNEEKIMQKLSLSQAQVVLQKSSLCQAQVVLQKKVTTEETNFFLLFHLSTSIGTEVVRSFFDRHVPPADLHNHLRKHEHNLRGKGECNPAQLNVLFPAIPLLPQSKNFNFSLLYKLIRNTLSIPPPAQGWGKKPLTNDISEADDIERVRMFRNYLAHNDICKLTEDIFKQTWSELSQAILRLSGGTLAEEIKALEQKSLVSSM